MVGSAITLWHHFLAIYYAGDFSNELDRNQKKAVMYIFLNNFKIKSSHINPG